MDLRRAGPIPSGITANLVMVEREYPGAETTERQRVGLREGRGRIIRGFRVGRGLRNLIGEDKIPPEGSRGLPVPYFLVSTAGVIGWRQARIENRDTVSRWSVGCGFEDEKFVGSTAHACLGYRPRRTLRIR